MRNTFENSGIRIDYLTFTFDSWFPEQEKRLVEFFSEYLMGCYEKNLQGTKSFTDTEKSHAIHAINEGDVCFNKTLTNSKWKGILVQIPSETAHYFYSLYKKKTINLDLFENARLSRLDLCFSRTHKFRNEMSSSNLFKYLQDCCNQAMNGGYTTQFKQGSNIRYGNGYLLTIAKRRSSRYFRIYERRENHTLRFEYELKGLVIQKYEFVFQNSLLEEFEDKLVLEYLKYFKKFLEINSSYSDWFLNLRRRNKKPCKQNSNNILNFDSMNLNMKISNEKSRKLILVLKFFQYLNELPNSGFKSLGETEYREVSFPLNDFIKYLNWKPHHSQTLFFKDFFSTLQENYYLEEFTNENFHTFIRSDSWSDPNDDSFLNGGTFTRLATIPKFQIGQPKGVRTPWIVTMVVVEEFFSFLKTYQFPDVQKNCSYKAKEWFVFTYLIVQYSSPRIEKEITLSRYLEFYNYSNGDITLIKKNCLEILQRLGQENYIEATCKVRNQIMNIDELTVADLSDSVRIYEKLD